MGCQAQKKKKTENNSNLCVDRIGIVREYGAVSGMCSEYSNADMSEYKRSKDALPNRSYTVAGSFDDITIYNSSDSGIEMFGGNVFYQSKGFGYCMQYEVSSRSKHNHTFFFFCRFQYETRFSISSIFCSYEDRSIPDLLAALTSRARIPDIQIAAARCLTYIHRSGSLCSTDARIVYKTLPCLARLCTEEFDEAIRATSAETLAYLAEVSHFHNFVSIQLN